MEHEWEWNEETKQWELSEGQQEQQKYETYQFTGEEKVTTSEKSGSTLGKKVLLTVSMAVLFGVVAGGVMISVNYAGNRFLGNKHQQVKTVESAKTPVEETVQQPTESEGYTVADVAERCMPSIVSITNASVARVQDFFGGYVERPVETTGSGIVVGQNDTELLIATNNHVVDGGETLTVCFFDETVCEATVKGNDPTNDLAVIAVKEEQITQDTLDKIRVVAIGDSQSLRIGEQVVAIGNALGYGQSVTSGWISALDRSVEDENGVVSEQLIQTDAAINHGNSGGPLLNMKGELIGINSAKMEGAQVEAMGYAIPIAKASPILDELMNRETRYKVSKDKAAYVGVTCLNVEASAGSMYGIPQGAFVDSVEPEGPADKAGVLKGDVIVKFDGVAVSGGTDLVNKLEYYEAGETVEIVVARAQDGEYTEQTITAVLGNRNQMKQSVKPR